MARLGFPLIVQEMLLQLSVITHGSEGTSVPTASILGFRFDSDYRKHYLLLGVTIVMLILARNLVRGRIGRAFRAMREHKRAAEAMGVHLAQYETIALAISALYTGLAGALSAFLVGFLDPQKFSFFLSIQFIIILRGLASLLGSVLGAGFLIILPELLAGLDVGKPWCIDHGAHHAFWTERCHPALRRSLIWRWRRARHPPKPGPLRPVLRTAD